MSDLSTFLFARPSVLEGVARVLDFGDTLTEYNKSLTGEQADYLALQADWRLVGGDIRSAACQFEGQSQQGAIGVQGQKE